jgi:hypothetical protein
MPPLVVGVLNVFAKVSLSPTSGGLPGTNEAEKVISDLGGVPERFCR